MPRSLDDNMPLVLGHGFARQVAALLNYVQAVLEAKLAEKPVSHSAAAKPGRTPTQTETPPRNVAVPGTKFEPGPIVATPVASEALRSIR